MRKKIVNPRTDRIVLLMTLTGSEHAPKGQENASGEKDHAYDDSSPVIKKEPTANAEEQDLSSHSSKDPADQKPEDQEALYKEERENSVKAKQPLKEEDKKRIDDKRLGDETEIDDETTI